MILDTLTYSVIAVVLALSFIVIRLAYSKRKPTNIKG
jgi:hypothetical protein